MKYIITENKMESMIKEYILKNYDVLDVEYTESNAYLASGPNKNGETTIKVKVINVYIENFKHQKRLSDIQKIKYSLWETLEGIFGINLSEYGTKWDLNVYQLKREAI